MGQARSVEELLAYVKTRRYPMARLRRMLLHSYLGLLPAERDRTPPYLRVLGADGRGRALLREMGDRAALPVLTKPADVRKLGEEARTLFAREAGWTDLYTLACPEPARPGAEYTHSPVML